MKLKLIASLFLLAAAGCTPGDKVSRLSVGQTKAQVVGLIGNPTGYASKGNDEVLQYLGGPPLWGSQVDEFQVTLHDGRVTGYEVTKMQAESINSNIFPIIQLTAT